MNTELKPCPHCGGEAESDSQQPYWNVMTGRVNKQAAVYCTHCSAHMTLCREDVPELDDGERLDVLVEQWNRRAESSPHVVAEPVAYMNADGTMAAGAKVYELMRKATPAKADRYMIPLYTHPAPQQTTPLTEAKSLVQETGWLIENGKSGSELRYRTWNELGAGPEWTNDHMKATRYCRRIDAERAAAGDEDAWCIVEHSWSNA